MTITSIIPVYNEERTIEDVLKVLVESKMLDEIVVVNDGSTDNTQKIIEKFKVKIINLRENVGKGRAIKIAVEKVESNIILLCDADLKGFKEEHIKTLLTPIDKVDMVIGLRDKRSVILNMFMPYFPLTSGERVIRREVLVDVVKNPLIEEWGLESVINVYCKKKKLRVKKVFLKDLNHIPHIKKNNLWLFLKQIYKVGIVRFKLLKVKF